MDQKQHIYIMTVLFAGGIAFGSRSMDSKNKHIWMCNIARYVLYILAVRAMYGACVLAHDVVRHKRAIDAQLLQKVHRTHAMTFFAAVGILLYNEQIFIDINFFMILIATVITKYPVVETNKKKISINYAVGMACSYFEGYLVHILPSDGTKFFGFLNNMRVYEDQQGVVFPVRKLFIVATKSLYSPPSLEDLNKPARDDVAYLEACSPLTNVEKDVAGVKNRIYKNFAYKIYRPRAPPVCVSAVGGTPLHTLSRVLRNREFSDGESESETVRVCLSAVGGTPLHTLSRVLRNREFSDELSGINREEIVADFFNTLRKLIAKSPDCRDKCELIYFDDADRNLNLADILLDRIRELEPTFEEIITQRR